MKIFMGQVNYYGERQKNDAFWELSVSMLLAFISFISMKYKMSYGKTTAFYREQKEH